MQTILTSEQMRQADQFTIENEPVCSVDLMERAAIAFVNHFREVYPDKYKCIAIYCGTGNNGGDGLAIGRLLSEQGFRKVNVKVIRFSTHESEDFKVNYSKLVEENISLTEIKESDPFPVEDAEIIIDALLGSGLNKPLDGAWKELVIWIRSLNRKVVSVDIPTGFKSEGIIGEKDIAIKADLTITFQRPKINFLLPESAAFIDKFEFVDIGLDESYIQSQESSYLLLTEKDIKERLIRRSEFSHKGTFGHALIIAGAPETMGAALLCSEASLHTGSGLTTACIPSEGLIALNCRIPEAMAAVRLNGELPKELNWEKYTSIAIGPGLGTSPTSKTVLEETLKNFNKPVVFDADAINLLAKNPELISMIHDGSILTPHVKEFDRLFGEHSNWWDRLDTGRNNAILLKCYIILKNRYSIIFTPEGKCLFNPTGSPGMATGGMGDVLTGMIASFLAQGYKSEDAAILGVYLHGKVGENKCEHVMTASGIVRMVSQVISLSEK